MNNSIPHDSAIKHVSGESVYINDFQVNSQLLIHTIDSDKNITKNI